MLLKCLQWHCVCSLTSFTPQKCSIEMLTPVQTEILEFNLFKLHDTLEMYFKDEKKKNRTNFTHAQVSSLEYVLSSGSPSLLLVVS